MIRTHGITASVAAATLLVFGAAIGSACSDDSQPTLESAGLSARDVPRDWQPADIEESQGDGLWDTLPDLLAVSSDARLVLRVFEAESGLHGAATMFIQTADPAAIPESVQNDAALTPLSHLLARQGQLLIPNPIAGDPGAYFSPAMIRCLVRCAQGSHVHSTATCCCTLTAPRLQLGLCWPWLPCGIRRRKDRSAASMTLSSKSNGDDARSSHRPKANADGAG